MAPEPAALLLLPAAALPALFAGVAWEPALGACVIIAPAGAGGVSLAFSEALISLGDAPPHASAHAANTTWVHT
jgi:hypothetical protein